MKKEQMLASVYFYISQFARTKKDKESVQKIIDAMKIIDRKFFLPSEYCYEDAAQQIGKGQTISQPSTVARMLMLAGLGKNNVLEIGTGSGWNASLISYIVYPGSVTAVERIESLTDNAQANIEKLRRNLSASQKKRLNNLELITADALDNKSGIWKHKYDRIIITAGIQGAGTEMIVKEMASALLKRNGLMVCPYTHGPIIVYKKDSGIKKYATTEYYVFVPLLTGIEK